MTSSPRLTFHVRLEDLVALTFFLLNLLLRIIFRGLKAGNFSPADVLIIIPAVTLLLAKEMVHYFMAGKPALPPGVKGHGILSGRFGKSSAIGFPFSLFC